MQEAILALWLEHKFTKDQILEMYLNRVYFGSGATGIQAAARRYYDKNADELTLIESATIAGLLKAPSRLSPARDPQAARARAEVVLQAMVDEGMITKAEADAAKAAKPTKPKSFWTGAQHYAADMVMRDLPLLVGGEIKEDVVVQTTIDLNLEKKAEQAIAKTIDRANQNVSQGALVSVDGTGAIRAIVGGRDYATSQFNRAVDAKRQPGSSFKPFVYETALEHGYRPETIVNDGPVRIGNWTPSNYDNKFRGEVSMADAVAKSLNTVAAKLTADLGPQTVIATAKRMGIQSPLVDNATLGLGTSEVSLLELTGAYAPFANGGYLATPHLVNRVTTSSGKVLYERDDAVPPVIVGQDVVGMMNAMLTRVVTSGTGRRASFPGWQIAGKSGTTQDFKDAWFIGYTSNLTTGVWLGNDNGKPMRQVTGGSLPADAWKDYMVAAHEGLPAVPLPGHYRIGDPANIPVASAQPNGAIIGYDAGGNPVYENTELPAGGTDPYGQTVPGEPTAIAPPAEDPAQAPSPEGTYQDAPVAAREPTPAVRDIPRYRETPNYRETPRQQPRHDQGQGLGGEDRGYASRPEQDLPSRDAYGARPAGRDPYGDPYADPYGDDQYGGPPPEYGEPARMRPPAPIAPARSVRRGDLPPDAVLEGPARVVRPEDLPPDAVLEGPAPAVGQATAPSSETSSTTDPHAGRRRHNEKGRGSVPRPFLHFWNLPRVRSPAAPSRRRYRRSATPPWPHRPQPWRRRRPFQRLSRPTRRRVSTPCSRPRRCRPHRLSWRRSPPLRPCHARAPAHRRAGDRAPRPSTRPRHGWKAEPRRWPRPPPAPPRQGSAVPSAACRAASAGRSGRRRKPDRPDARRCDRWRNPHERSRRGRRG